MLTLLDFLAFCDPDESEEIKHINVDEVDAMEICEIHAHLVFDHDHEHSETKDWKFLDAAH